MFLEGIHYHDTKVGDMGGLGLWDASGLLFIALSSQNRLVKAR